MTNKNEKKESEHFKYYLKHDMFLDYLKELKTYREIYSSKEGIISIIL